MVSAGKNLRREVAAASHTVQHMIWRPAKHILSGTVNWLSTARGEMLQTCASPVSKAQNPTCICADSLSNVSVMSLVERSCTSWFASSSWTCRLLCVRAFKPRLSSWLFLRVYNTHKSQLISALQDALLENPWSLLVKRQLLPVITFHEAISPGLQEKHSHDTSCLYTREEA